MKLKSLALLLSLITVFSCCQNKKKTDCPPKKVTAKKTIPKMLWDSTNTLENNVQTLRLRFISVGCACPEWVRLKDQNLENVLNYCIYIEPADTSMWNPENDSIAWKTGIIVTGQFYVKPSYPKGAFEGMEDKPPMGKIFRYTRAKRDTH
ncbi:MAG: hypothetical protein JST50_20575 [Bacteroidetes bacterium]|jgi:hypothetical protein|nr:hypothetical protein [Bacteroidota bacterium]